MYKTLGNCQYDKEELIKITFVLSKYKTDRSKEIDTCSKTCGKVVSSFDIQYASDTVNILITCVWFITDSAKFGNETSKSEMELLLRDF